LNNKYETAKKELEEALAKLEEQINVDKSEKELHISKLERQITLSEIKYMEEVLFPICLQIVCVFNSGNMEMLSV
jgi:golgin subfamily A member 4